MGRCWCFFRGYQQQDAHEFMRYLLDRLHTELLAVLPYPNNKSLYIGPKGKSTIVSAIFGGILQNEVNCLICGVESKKHDPFLGEWIGLWLGREKGGEGLATYHMNTVNNMFRIRASIIIGNPYLWLIDCDHSHAALWCGMLWEGEQESVCVCVCVCVCVITLCRNFALPIYCTRNDCTWHWNLGCRWEHNISICCNILKKW